MNIEYDGCMHRGLIWGCLFAITSIGLGALLTHVLNGNLTSRELEVLDVAATYLFYMAMPLLLLFVSHAHWQWPNRMYNLFILSGGLFSGSLILFVFTNMYWLVWITPVGGVLMMLSWVYLLVYGTQKVRS